MAVARATPADDGDRGSAPASGKIRRRRVGRHKNPAPTPLPGNSPAEPQPYDEADEEPLGKSDPVVLLIGEDIAGLAKSLAARPFVSQPGLALLPIIDKHGRTTRRWARLHDKLPGSRGGKGAKPAVTKKEKKIGRLGGTAAALKRIMLFWLPEEA